ncbi:hypothetical protein BDN72DRAFT_899338 [Pluteus cervinus]|uniref:Uncharacterized protein n=1 Tax=Pluteus cervinus TaxID=181527 RepID=A0ACD3AMV1_9AGAR|nr:hypothetical protein BDN72DRAFT_899338 [Pluteus cervinus]
MDAHYNITGAQVCLTQYASQEQNSDQRYLSEVDADTEWVSSFDVHAYNDPVCWRLIRRTEGGEPEEAVFNLMGVVAAKDLPPVKELHTRSSRSAAFMQQSITLTGLSTIPFEHAMDKAVNVHDKFRRCFPEEKLQAWSSMPCTVSSGRTISLSNRYFTLRSEAPSSLSIPFPEEVDPLRLLSKLVTPLMIHTSDNEVAYFERFVNAESEIKHRIVQPQVFRIGDIVDVQFTFVAYRMRTGQHVLKNMLYSVTLVNGKFADMFERARSDASIKMIPSVRALKRKVGYDTDTQDNATRSPPKQARKVGQHNSPDIATEKLSEMHLD